MSPVEQIETKELSPDDIFDLLGEDDKDKRKEEDKKDKEEEDVEKINKDKTTWRK